MAKPKCKDRGQVARPEYTTCTNMTLCHIPALDMAGKAIDLTVDKIVTQANLADLPVGSGSSFVVANPTIVLDNSISIPTAVVGTDNFLLANPVPTGGGWVRVDIGDGSTNKYMPFWQF